jgi:hypothetical protein
VIGEVNERGVEVATSNTMLRVRNEKVNGVRSPVVDHLKIRVVDLLLYPFL